MNYSLGPPNAVLSVINYHDKILDRSSVLLVAETNLGALVCSPVQNVGTAPSLREIVMERSRSYFLTLISIVSVILAVYLWSDKNQTVHSLELAMNELRELNNRFDPADVNEAKTDDYRSILEDIGSGDMKQFYINLISVPALLKEF